MQKTVYRQSGTRGSQELRLETKQGECKASQVAQRYRIRLPIPTVHDTQVQSLGREDPLEEGMATHFGILVWRILWTEELESQRVGHNGSDLSMQS